MDTLITVKYTGLHYANVLPETFESIKKACEYAVDLDHKVRQNVFGGTWDDNVLVYYGAAYLTSVRKNDTVQDLMFRCNISINELKVLESTHVPPQFLK